MTSQDLAIKIVLRRVLVLNLIVAIVKLILGFLTGAIAIIADGFHSLVDSLANVVALVAQSIAAQPPDEDHPYGHRRFEAIGTFIIGGFLLLVAWEVLQAAIERLISSHEPSQTPESFFVLLLTLAINIGVVAYERKRGKALASRVLLADAEHTLTDVMVTCSVLVSLVLVGLGFGWADAVVALLIVVVIGHVGWRIMSESMEILVDRVALPSTAIAQVALNVPDVESVLQVRSRGAMNDIRVDLMAQVRPEITADHAHQIADAVTQRIQEHFPMIQEVQVSFAPQQPDQPDYPLLARAVADGLGLAVHEVIAIPTENGVMLEMHVEVRRGLSLSNAHAQVSALETKLTERDDVATVVTHIEPRSGQGAPLTQSHQAMTIRNRALQLADELYPNANWHDSHIRLALGGYALTMHCHLPGSVSIEEAHHIAEQVETQIRAEMPHIQRVTIHTEPEGA